MIDFGVAAYIFSQIKQSDPAHTVMIGAYGLAQANQYADIADMVGNEIYPVTTNPLLPVSANLFTWDTVARNMAGLLQTYADNAHKQSAFILQAFTWGDNVADGTTIGVCTPDEKRFEDCYAQLRYPSPGEQLQLRNEILQYAHPGLILWYSFWGTYGQVGTDTTSIYPTGAEAASRWAGLSAGSSQPPSPSAASTTS